MSPAMNAAVNPAVNPAMNAAMHPAQLSAHPRLHASRTQLHRLAAPVKLRFLRAASQRVARRADEALTSPETKFDSGLHNPLLVRARAMQRRVVTLLVRWFQSGQAKYRQAAIDHVFQMGRWTYWCSDAQLQKDPRPEAFFDLSYGENSATIAIAYDWLFDDLSDAERQRFREIAQTRSLGPFLAQLSNADTGGKTAPFWFCHPSTNWNSVCVGGPGMLALTMFEELPEAAQVLALAEQSIAVYMRELDKTAGGWVEGIGYWGYGHRYAFMYLLSHQRATGLRHPLLQTPAAKKTLRFPLDFCPWGVPCSFGDVNDWRPLPFHYAAAVQLRQMDVAADLDSRIMHDALGEGADWPDDAEWLVFHRRSITRQRRRAKSSVVHYPGMDWFTLADHSDPPRLYLTLRGGTTRVPHSHQDLLSFHCAVGGESLITSLGNRGGEDYLDTTFSRRRNELFEVSPQSKNTVLINAVGIAPESSVTATVLNGPRFKGVRMEGTQAFGISAGDQPAADFFGRLFLMIDDRFALIIDRFKLPRPGRVETRLHSYARCVFASDFLSITGKKERLRVSFASTVPACLLAALTSPSTPAHGATVARWCTIERTHTDISMLTLLSPGTGRLMPHITQSESGLDIQLSGAQQLYTLAVSHTLDRIKLRTRNIDGDSNGAHRTKYRRPHSQRRAAANGRNV